MSFIPFGFYRGGEVWTPEQLTGLDYYWKSDYGVTQTSNLVTQWDSKVGSLSLTNTGGTTRPDYESSVSAWNNQPAIKFNDGSVTEYLSAGSRISVSTSDYPFVWWIAEVNSNASGGYQIIGGDAGPDSSNQEWVLETNHPSAANQWSEYNYYIEQSGGHDAPGCCGAISAFKGWVGLASDNSNKDGYYYKNGVVNSTWISGTYGWGDGTRGSGIDLVVGNYGAGQTLGFKGRIFEMGFQTTEPTADEISKMETYINTYYGITYSN